MCWKEIPCDFDSFNQYNNWNAYMVTHINHDNGSWENPIVLGFFPG